MVQKEEVVSILKQVFDPEIGLDIWTLGLVYNIDLQETSAHIKMTFTTPMCPYGPMLVSDIERRMELLMGKGNTKIEIVFDPPWKPSDEVKALLGVL